MMFFIIIFTVFCLTIPETSSLEVTNITNPLVTHWTEEEAAMRNRMEQYAKEKFSQHYHFFQNFTDNETKKIPKRQEIVRKKREAVMGSIATAVVTGMIGIIKIFA